MPANAILNDGRAVDSTTLAREWVRFQRTILTFIGSLVHNFSEAEELLQETAAQIFSQESGYDPSRPFLPYAFGVARNVVLMHQRRFGRNPVIFDQEAVDRLATAFIELDRNLECELRVEALRRCYGKLSQQARRLCRLRYEEDLGSEEIAAQTGATAGSVRISLHRIREQLKDCVQRQLLDRGNLR